MLKLLKYDLISAKKRMLVLYLITFVTMLLVPFLLKWNNTDFEESNVLSTVIGVLLLLGSFMIFSAASMLLTVFCYKHVHDTLFTKQGYLTFTLPYKTWEIVMSKILFVVVYTLGYLVVISIGVTLMFVEVSWLFNGENSIKDMFLIIPDLLTMLIHGFSSVDVTDNVFSQLISILDSIVCIPLYIILFILGETLVITKKAKKIHKGEGIIRFIALVIGLSIIKGLLQRIGALMIDSAIIISLIGLIVDLFVVVCGYQYSIYLLEYKLELN